MQLTILFELLYANCWLKKITDIRTFPHIFFLLFQTQFVMRKSLIIKKFSRNLVHKCLFQMEGRANTRGFGLSVPHQH